MDAKIEMESFDKGLRGWVSAHRKELASWGFISNARWQFLRDNLWTRITSFKDSDNCDIMGKQA